MILVNDFVVREDICNMRCDYCLTGTSLYKKMPSEQSFDDKLTYCEGTQLQKNIDDITSRLYQRFKPAILKISGGEILLIRGIIDYLNKHSSNYARVQLLTNGLLLSPDIVKELTSIHNLSLQISLDHHTLEGNIYRTKEQEVLLRILRNLDHAATLGINIEINCVLNNMNTHIIPELAQFLLKYRGNVILLPFPIRGRNKNRYTPSKKQLAGIDILIREYEEYQDILPPIKYLEALYMFMSLGHRNNKCNFPRLALGSFDNGEITPCANYWFTSLGSILGEDYKHVLDKVETDKIYNLLCNKRHMLNECNHCFTPWEILNLYKEGNITKKELKKIHLYSFEGIEKYLDN